MHIPDTNSPLPPNTNVGPRDDYELRNQIAGAFLSAHRGWRGNKPDDMIIDSPADAQALAAIAVTLFRKSQL